MVGLQEVACFVMDPQQVCSDSIQSVRRWACAVGAISSLGFVARGGLNRSCEGASLADVVARTLALCYSMCGLAGALSKTPRTAYIGSRVMMLLGLVLSGANLSGWCVDLIEWTIISFSSSLLQLATASIIFPNANRVTLLLSFISCLALGFSLHLALGLMPGNEEGKDPEPPLLTRFWLIQSVVTLAGTLAGRTISTSKLQVTEPGDIEKSNNTKNKTTTTVEDDNLQKIPNTTESVVTLVLSGPSTNSLEANAPKPNEDDEAQREHDVQDKPLPTPESQECLGLGPACQSTPADSESKGSSFSLEDPDADDARVFCDVMMIGDEYDVYSDC